MKLLRRTTFAHGSTYRSHLLVLVPVLVLVLVLLHSGGCALLHHYRSCRLGTWAPVQLRPLAERHCLDKALIFKCDLITCGSS